MPDKPQSFDNHLKLVPWYHFVAFTLLVVNQLWTVWRLYKDPGIGNAIGVLTAFALVLTLFYARIFPLKVQDRLIRLEERLRMQRLLPAELHGRIDGLRPQQMVALRFASDEELPELTQWVLEEGVRDTKAIKQRIRNWRADHARM